MAKKIEKKEPVAVDTAGDFEFMNQSKYDRAVSAVGNEDKEALLVEYDRLGGYIRYQGNKVVNGSFWDRKTGGPVATPSPKVIKKQAAVIEETIEVVTPVKKSKKTEETE